MPAQEKYGSMRKTVAQRLERAIIKTIKREFVPIIRALRDAERKLDYVVNVIHASQKQVEAQVGLISSEPVFKGGLEPYFEKFRQAAEKIFEKPVILEKKRLFTDIKVDGMIYGKIDNSTGSIYKVRSHATGYAKRDISFGNITDDWHGCLNLRKNGWKVKSSIE